MSVFDVVLGLVFALARLVVSLLAAFLGLLGFSIAGWSGLLSVVIAFLVLAVFVRFILEHSDYWLHNLVAGVIVFVALRYFTGITLPVTLVTVLITLLFGVPGVLALVILYLGGVL